MTQKHLRDSTVYDYRRNKIETIGDRPIQTSNTFKDKWIFAGALIGVVILVIAFTG